MIYRCLTIFWLFLIFTFCSNKALDIRHVFSSELIKRQNYEGENIIHGFNLIDRGRSDGARLYVLLSANRGNGMGP